MMDVVTIGQARQQGGLRLITRAGVPTPWAQAAKGIIELKKLKCVLAQEAADERGAQLKWIGDPGAPFLAYEDERIRSNWIEILELAERLAPVPRLIPRRGPHRALMYGLANELCGEMGLAWSLHLLMVHRSLEKSDSRGAFPENIARKLGKEYGYTPERAATAEARVRDVLKTLSEALGDRKYFFRSLSALDIYWATFANMFMLLSEDEMPAISFVRDTWAGVGGGQFIKEVPKNLRRLHRRMYERYLGLPLQL